MKDRPERIVVQGLWHLGCVTAACLARAGFHVVGFDADAAVIEDLGSGRLPLYEPGLAELFVQGLNNGRLRLSSDPNVVSEADLVWVTFDTPVDDDDRADAGQVVQAVKAIMPFVRDETVLLISSQVPVGSTRALADHFAEVAAGRRVEFACSPENLRLGDAIERFESPDRIVVGTEDRQPNAILSEVLGHFCPRLIWMSLESAEMVKHALNAFLATSIAFINEVASVAEAVGAQAGDIEEGLKSEGRIGRKAYLKPGSAFAGGTLARDIMYLRDRAEHHAIATPLLGSLMASNAHHRQWPLRRLYAKLGSDLCGRAITVLGLSYKADSDTLRRSTAVELCLALAQRGARVQAFDPHVVALPPDLAEKISLRPTLEAALSDADAAVVATGWPGLRAVPPDLFATRMRTPVVVDQDAFLAGTLAARADVQYGALGYAS